MYRERERYPDLGEGVEDGGVAAHVGLHLGCPHRAQEADAVLPLAAPLARARCQVVRHDVGRQAGRRHRGEEPQAALPPPGARTRVDDRVEAQQVGGVAEAAHTAQRGQGLLPAVPLLARAHGRVEASARHRKVPPRRSALSVLSL